MLRKRFPQASAGLFARLASVLAFVIFGHADRCFADFVSEQRAIGNYDVFFDCSGPSTLDTDRGNGGSNNGADDVEKLAKTETQDDVWTAGGADLTSAVGSIDVRSTNLGVATGANATIVAWGSMNVSSGAFDVEGGDASTVNSFFSFNAGGPFTFTSAPSEFVAINVAAGNLGTRLNDAMNMIGIDTDQALFESFDGGCISARSGDVSSFGTPFDSAGTSSETNSRYCPANVLQLPTAIPRSSRRASSNPGPLPAWL